MGDASRDDLDHVTFEILITHQERAIVLKKIPLLALLVFYGMVTKNPDTFLFEFDVLCKI